jgi:heme exporter protein A
MSGSRSTRNTRTLNTNHNTNHTLANEISPIVRSVELKTRVTGATRPLSSIQHTATPVQLTLPAVIEVRDLKKSYGFKPVLRTINLTLLRGQRLALIGPNGAGKTTLLRILAGLNKPGSGTVVVAGFDCVEQPQQLRQSIGFVAHQPYLYEDLTALENLLFFARMYNVAHPQERAIDLLQRMGLTRKMHDRVSALSRGQVQRVAWARALVHSPHILLLDEPDTGLDQDGDDLIISLFAEHIANGGSILFTTHQLERARALSDSIDIIAGGRIVYHQDSSTLTTADLQQTYREATR